MKGLHTILWFLVGTILYVALARAGFVLQHFNHSIPIWPAAGLGLALVWWKGWKLAPVVFFGELVFGLSVGNGLLPALGVGVGATLATLFGTWLLVRSGANTTFQSMQDVVAFLLCGVCATAIVAAFLSATFLMATGLFPPRNYLAGVSAWALGDAMGILIVAPLITHWKAARPNWNMGQAGWLLFALAGTVTLSVLIMTLAGAPLTMFFLLLPLAVVAACTGRMLGATAVSTLMAACIFGLALHGMSSYATTLVRIAFVGSTTLTAYLLAVALTEKRQAWDQLARQASRDSLTQLANRSTFDQCLQAMVREDGTHVLLYVDLDQFKLINDSRGHQVGDRFLVQLSKRLRAVVPEDAVVARLGGDEFGILLARVDDDRARTLAETVQKAIVNFRHDEDGGSFRVHASIGMTLFGNDEAADHIFTRADMACYAAKRDGRTGVHEYRRDDPELLAEHAEVRRASQLHDELDSGRFRLVYQQIVPLGATSPEEPAFFEVLLRPLDEDGRLLSPGAFLATAERYGLMPVVDRWVVENSFRFLAESGGEMCLSINLFGTTMDDPGLYDVVMNLAQRHGIDPRKIVFEITENVAIQHLRAGVHSMARLMEAGFRFSLDDFGSGVASFGYLQELPVDFVKIDGRFIRDMDKDPGNPVIIESLVRLSRLKHIQCIGEWVENERILEQIRMLGVAYGQGFHLHRPQPLPAPPHSVEV